MRFTRWKLTFSEFLSFYLYSGLNNLITLLSLRFGNFLLWDRICHLSALRFGNFHLRSDGRFLNVFSAAGTYIGGCLPPPARIFTHVLTLAIFLPITTGKKIYRLLLPVCHFFGFQTGIFLPTRIELPNWGRELPVFTGKLTGKRKYWEFFTGSRAKKMPPPVKITGIYRHSR